VCCTVRATRKRIGRSFRNMAGTLRNDRGRENSWVCALPPSEPDLQISRIRLSS